jgi:hypothetical protein
MSAHSKAALVTALSGLVLIVSGGQSAFADPPVVGGISVTPVPAAAPPLSFTADGDPIAKPADPPALLPDPPAAPSAAAIEARFKAARARQIRRWTKLILSYRKSAEKWAQIRGEHVRTVHQRQLAGLSLPVLRTKLKQWKRVDNRERLTTQHPPHYAQFMCIHSHEGSWNDQRNPKFDGGLQMDKTFQSSYAPWLVRLKGPAYNWTPLEQIWAAERAFRTRGFGPWPNTRLMCGL